MRVEAFTRYKKAAARRINPNTGWISGTSTIQLDPNSDFEDEVGAQLIEENQDEKKGPMKDVVNLIKHGFDDIMKSFTEDEELENDNLNKEKLAALEERMINREQSLWELAKIEGDDAYLEWVDKHIWTYVGLSAPLLGASNTLRSVISGEKMGMPLAEDVARQIELCKVNSKNIAVFYV